MPLPALAVVIPLLMRVGALLARLGPVLARIGAQMAKMMPSLAKQIVPRLAGGGSSTLRGIRAGFQMARSRIGYGQRMLIGRVQSSAAGRVGARVIGRIPSPVRTALKGAWTYRTEIGLANRVLRQESWRLSPTDTLVDSMHTIAALPAFTPVIHEMWFDFANRMFDSEGFGEWTEGMDERYEAFKADQGASRLPLQWDEGEDANRFRRSLTTANKDHYFESIISTQGQTLSIGSLVPYAQELAMGGEGVMGALITYSTPKDFLQMARFSDEVKEFIGKYFTQKLNDIKDKSVQQVAALLQQGFSMLDPKVQALMPEGA